jgi:hypothetical protein
MYARAVRVSEQRVQDDKKDLDQRNGQRMIAATSQRRAGVSQTPPHHAAHQRAQVTARLRWPADGLAGHGGTHDVRFDHVLVRAGDRIDPREPDRGARNLQSTAPKHTRGVFAHHSGRKRDENDHSRHYEEAGGEALTLWKSAERNPSQPKSIQCATASRRGEDPTPVTTSLSALR